MESTRPGRATTRARPVGPLDISGGLPGATSSLHAWAVCADVDGQVGRVRVTRRLGARRDREPGLRLQSESPAVPELEPEVARLV